MYIKTHLVEGTCKRTLTDRVLRCTKAVWGFDNYGCLGYYCSAYPYKPARHLVHGCYLSSLGREVRPVTTKMVNPLKASKRANK
jgi:hypothetical protein